MDALKAPVLLVLLVIGFAGPAAALGTSGTAPAPARSSYRAGQLVVKFRPETWLPAAVLFRSRQPWAAYTGSGRLDALNQRYQVAEVRQLFPARDAGAAHPADQDTGPAAWTSHLDRVRQRFAQRARRAPQGLRLPDLSGVYEFTVPADVDVAAMAAAYAADPAVEYAEPSHARTLDALPDDPFLHSSGSWGQRFADVWGLGSIAAEGAWDRSTGAGVVVAVIDSGLNYAFDMDENVWVNPGEDLDGDGRVDGANSCPIPQGDFNCVDDDGDGIADDVAGWWNEVTQPGVPGRDDVGHGTHVAGTIAARGDNGVGIAGVAWQAKIMPVAVFDQLGSTTALIAQALVYATDHGADVINMSFGGIGESLIERDAIDYAAAQGTVLVASAGNETEELRTRPPATLDPVIAVAAVDHLDGPASFTNYGGKIDLAAPGGGDRGPPGFLPSFSVLSLAPNNGLFDPRLILPAAAPGGTSFLARLAGTSMAAPHVSGVAALVLGRHPEFTSEQVRQVLRRTADDLGPPGRDVRSGYGRVNAERAVAVDQVAVARLHAPAAFSRVYGELIAVEGTVDAPSGGAVSWRVLLGPEGGTATEIANGTGALASGTLASVDTAALDRGRYVLRLAVESSTGATGTDEVMITRLADRAYLRQVSDLDIPLVGDALRLSRDAWGADGSLVWVERPGFGVQRVVLRDPTTAARTSVLAYSSEPVGTFVPLEPLVETVISRDGSTVVSSGPQDLIPFGEDYQLFVYDRTAAVLTQATAVSSSFPNGCGQQEFCSLSISEDGGTLAFLSRLDLDPSVGNPDGAVELFLWDRTTSAFHQLTQRADPGEFGAIKVLVSADGRTIVCTSQWPLDPGAAPSAPVDLFTYDVPSGQFHQVTNLSGFPPRTILDFDVDAAATTAVLSLRDEGAGTDTFVRLDLSAGTMQTILTAPSTFATFPYVRSSPDGGAVVFLAETAPDRLAPPPAGAPARELFRYDVTSGELRRLTAAGFLNAEGLAVSPEGRIALVPNAWNIDPEGANPDGGGELYVIDPSVRGGFLRLARGRIGGKPDGNDTFRFQGMLIRPGGAAIDPGIAEVGFTVLGAGGQLVRQRVPAGAMAGSGGQWAYRGSAPTGLRRLQLRTTDGVHYVFKAIGRSPGLYAGATPSLAVEVQIGEATFSDGARYRAKGRTLRYP